MIDTYNYYFIFIGINLFLVTTIRIQKYTIAIICLNMYFINFFKFIFYLNYYNFNK